MLRFVSLSDRPGLRLGTLVQLGLESRLVTKAGLRSPAWAAATAGRSNNPVTAD